MAGKKRTNKANKAQGQHQANVVNILASDQPIQYRLGAITPAEQGSAQYNSTPKQPPVKTAALPKPAPRLELPDGYKRPKKSSNKKRPSHKTASLPGADCNPRPEIQPCLRTTLPVNMGKRNPLAGVADKELHPEIEQALAIVKVQRGERLPHNAISKFFQVKNRVWKSLGRPAEAQRFLSFYDQFQKTKLDPPVFAVEEPDPTGTPLYGHSKSAKDLADFAAAREAYYITADRADKLEALKSNANWPKQFGIVSKAPFVRTLATEHCYVEHPSNHALPIFKAMALPEIAQAIISHMSDFLSLARLSETCHRGFDIVAMNTERWDTTAGDFLGDDQMNGDTPDHKPSRIPVIVGPVRKDMRATDRRRPDNTGYGNEFGATVKLFKALDFRAMSIACLQLHRLSFLEIAGIKCILTSLPNLENLGVYQCPLLHFGKAKELLDVVKAHPREVGGTEKYVNLDFFPMFHQGPNTPTRHGSFGVSWGFIACDTVTAIMQVVLYELYPLARELGINLFAWGSAFRLFLEKCPMPDWTVVRVYEAIRTFECAQGTPSIADLNDYTPECNWRWRNFVNELTAAIVGDDWDAFAVNNRSDHRLEDYVKSVHRIVKYRRQDLWWQRRQTCATCTRSMIRLFFVFGEGFCWGCILKQHLSSEVDHHRSIKAETAAKWLCGSQPISAARARLLTDGQYMAPLSERNAAPGAASPQKFAQLVPARCLQDALIDERVEAGSYYAALADRIRGHEVQNNHELGTNYLEDPDALRLERRHAKVHEKHGPIDRKTNDRQYAPVGWFYTTVSQKYAPCLYADLASSFNFRDWEELARLKNPGLTSSQMRVVLVKKWKRYVGKHKERHQGEYDHFNFNDSRNVAARHSQIMKRITAPNRVAGSWDMLVDNMLREKHGQHFTPEVKMDPNAPWGSDEVEAETTNKPVVLAKVSEANAKSKRDGEDARSCLPMQETKAVDSLDAWPKLPKRMSERTTGHQNKIGPKDVGKTAWTNQHTAKSTPASKPNQAKSEPQAPLTARPPNHAKTWRKKASARGGSSKGSSPGPDHFW